MGATLSADSVVVASKNQVSCDLAEEAAILNVKNGVYYGLDPVGARIWKLIREPRTVREVCEAVVGEYDIEPERCESDLLELLENLLAEGLIEVQSAAST